MIKSISLICALIGLLASAAVPPARADSWVFDKGNSSLRFSWDHLGLARQFGRFTEFDGKLEFSPTEPEQGAITVKIRARSLLSGIKELDDALKSVDFFDVAHFPEITFKSSSVRATGERAGEVWGDLTIHGITRPVMLAVNWTYTGEHPLSSINPAYLRRWVSGFQAKTTVARSDFGLKRALPLVSDDVLIEIDAEFLREEGAATAPAQ